MFAHGIDSEDAEAFSNKENIKIDLENAPKACDMAISDSQFDQLTRYPISIFRQIEKSKNEEEKIRLDRLLNELRNALPEGYKIGAAIRGGDCFFDSVAQGLNQLKKKSIITNSKHFNVKLLRENCASYARKFKEQHINGAKELKKRHDVQDKAKILDMYLERITKTAEEVEYPIWGRPETEGKMICKKYDVKFTIIELRDEEIDGLHVAKSKIGEGNNIIYLGNYRNHLVPLLSDVEEDIKIKIKVSREETYDNAVDSNSNFISQTDIFKHEQSNYLKSPGKKNHETDRKRKRELSVSDIDNNIPKRTCLNVNTTNNDNDNSICTGDLSVQDEMNNTYETKRYIPHHLIALMYRLDLSLLCSLRKSIYEHKYPYLSLMFEDIEIDKFNDIVLYYEKKSIHIQIENVDKYCIVNNITYADLFIKQESFSINNYFNSFVKYLIFKSDKSPNNIEYLIIYTNSYLSLTKEKKLKQWQCKKFYPFKFDSVDMEKCEILKDFLFTNDNIQGRDFYQFSKDETTREELLKRLKLSTDMKNLIKERGFSEEFEKETKNVFLDKLLFAVNQPGREELNFIVKNEIGKCNEVQKDYITLQERVLSKLERHEKLENHISEILREFNILMLFLHNMFLNKNLFSINFGEKSYDLSNNIIINYKNRVTCFKIHKVNSDIDYSQLSSSIKQNNTISIDELFALSEKSGENFRYLIYYTNLGLDLTEENELKAVFSRNFYNLKFDSIDIQKKRYKVLRNCSCINVNGLYQLAREEETREKLLSLLKLPPILQKEKENGELSNEREREIKENFLNRLIFAVNQPNSKELNNYIKNEIEESNRSNKIPYNYEALYEIALRWLESHEFGSVTKEIMEKILSDIKNNRFNYHKVQDANVDEIMKFIKIVASKEGTPAFDQFLVFLNARIGRKYLEVLKRNGIYLANICNMLATAGLNASKTFKDLCDLWFDEKGDKTRYLRTLEKEKINLVNVSNILRKAGANAVKAFKELYDLWFDVEGNKTRYLKILKEKEINLTNLSSILSGAGPKAPKVSKDLFDLWFDETGNKTQYLENLEREGIYLRNMSSILNGIGVNAPKVYKSLYDLWFDEQGNKTSYLKTLEKEKISLSNMSNILSGARANAPKAFKDLYDLWFDEKGDKTRYLKTLENERINLANVSNILSKSGANAVKAFKDLYDLWFDKEGNKTHYLKTLEIEEINLSNVSNILSGVGVNGAKAFKDLYNLWFDEQGNKTLYLQTLETERINLASVCNILSTAGFHAAEVFKNLYNLWFDEQGNKTLYLKALEKERINLTNISNILAGTGVNAPKAFKSLYDLWFDKQGYKTQYLKTLEKEDVNLSIMSSILRKAGTKAVNSFKDLYNLWFDKDGNKTQYLKTLEKEKINLTNVSSILCGGGASGAKAFRDLYGLWFDEEGNKTRYLKTLEENGINLSNVSSILNGAGANGAKAFKNLYDLWFDDHGNKTHYLETLKNEGVYPSDISSILHSVGINVTKAFKDLYGLWFDEQGNKTQYLKTLEEYELKLINVASFLSGTGANAAKAFKDLYDGALTSNEIRKSVLLRKKWSRN